jgi:hypothetical protein
MVTARETNVTFDRLACHGTFVVDNKRVTFCRYECHILGVSARGR